VLFDAIVLGGLLPAAAAAAVLLVALRPWSREPPDGVAARAAPAVALAVAYVLGHAATAGLSLPPRAASDWLPWMALVAAASSIGEAWLTKGKASPLTARAGASLLVAWLLLRPAFGERWSSAASVLVLLALAAGLVTFWSSVDRLARRNRGVHWSLALLVVAGASGPVLVLSDTALLGQLTSGLVAALGVSLLVAWWVPGARLSSAAPPLSVLLFALWTIGWLYAELPLASGLLLLLAPALPLAAERAAGHRAGWAALTVRLLLVTLPVGAALGLAARRYLTPPPVAEGAEGGGDDDYGY